LLADAQFAIDFLNGGGEVISSSTLNLLPTLFVPNGQPFNYKQYSVLGMAPAGTVQVQARASMIGSQSNPAGGGQAFVVDDFTLQAVPEPATIAAGPDWHVRIGWPRTASLTAVIPAWRIVKSTIAQGRSSFDGPPFFILQISIS
jgi:hypothetical protein